MGGICKRAESGSQGDSLLQGKRAKRLTKLAAAEYVFDDPGDAKEWLSNPHLELAGRTPLEAAQSEIGARNAEHILDRVFYGLPVYLNAAGKGGSVARRPDRTIDSRAGRFG
jgi:uncharacterized protein (DUF2384 family)